jgi:acyl-CoA thioesterase-2
MGESLLAMLDLEPLDRDLFRADTSRFGSRPNLFGGEVAAQALRAATLTVPEARYPHSLHGYFLRRGTSDHAVILRVFRDRDGGSFSARRVVALQDGEAIFTVSTSFHAQEQSGEYQVDMPVDAPDPETLPPSFAGGPADFVETRVISPSSLWIRSSEKLPDDDAIHACVLTYITDFGSGFAGTEIPGLAGGGPSLDHCMWFHHPIRLDGWVLLELWPLRASSARGTYMGTVHDQSGNLGCVLAQEALLRVRPDDAGPPAGKS